MSLPNTSDRHLPPDVTVSPLATLLETINDVAWIAKPDGQILFINSATERLYGLPRSTFMASTQAWLSMVDERDQSIAINSNRQLRETGTADIEYRIRRPDGESIWIHDRKQVIRDDDGQPAFLVGIATDITQRRLIADQVIESHQMLKAIHEIESDFISDAPTNEVFDGLLDALLAITSSEYGFVGEILRPESGDPYLKTHSISNIAWDDDSRAFYEENAANGFEFRNLETLFGVVIRSGQLVISNDPLNDNRAGGIPEGHPDLNTFMGIPLYSHDELVGMAGLANRPGGYSEQLAKQIQPLVSVCESLVLAYRTERQRQKARKQLEQSEQRFRNLIENSFDVILLTDTTGRVEYASPSAQRILGLAEDLADFDILQSVQRDQSSRVRRQFEQCVENPQGPAHFECLLENAAGELRTVEVTLANMLDESSVKAMVWNIRNVTERARAQDALREKESQMLHATRLSLMGEMVAGIAHELNQPLMAISNFAEACSLTLEKDNSSQSPQIRQWLSRIAEQALRCGDIIKRLRGFVKKGNDERTTLSLAAAIDESVEMVRADARFRSTEIACSFCDSALEIAGNRVQIEQVLVNLLLNACESIGAGNQYPGQIDISTAGDNAFARIVVSDNGPGIPADHASRLFEPFFTTKQSGVGIGLSISRSIIENHGGRLWAEPNQPQGTRFFIELPLSTALTAGQTCQPNHGLIQ